MADHSGLDKVSGRPRIQGIMPARTANAEILQALCQEGERLAKERPRCHYTSGDLQCVLLITKLHAAGFDVSLADAHRCLERMRIAVGTGSYPHSLLQAEEDAEPTQARLSAGPTMPPPPLPIVTGKPPLSGRRRRGTSDASAVSDPQTAPSVDCKAGHPEIGK
jgi:hypothetical protein